MNYESNAIWTLIIQSGPVVKIVLLILLFLSVQSWSILFIKLRQFRAINHQNREFENFFWSSRSLDEVALKVKNASPLFSIFEAGYTEIKRQEKEGESFQTIERSLHMTLQKEANALEKNLIILATTASAAPFIGLFGTVWGIMDSFMSIGASGSANLAVVAPGIAEALIATALGLWAAIPASIGYNTLLAKTQRISLDYETFVSHFLNLVQRKSS